MGGDAAPPPPQTSETRRDALLALEETVQKEWAKEGTFEADAAEDGRPKFFVTFPRRAGAEDRAFGKKHANDAARELGDQPRVCPGTRRVRRTNLPGSTRRRCLTLCQSW